MGHPYLYHPELWLNPDRLAQVIGGAQALIVRNHTVITAELLDAAPTLRVIGRLGVGLDNIDLTAAAARKVIVVHAHGTNAIAVLEYVLAALLYSMRPWLDWSHQTKHGIWQRRAGGREVFGKSLGIIGMGDIGSRVARATRRLGMTVYGYDPHVAAFHPLIADGTVIASPSIDVLLGQADVVTLHAPLRPDTYHLLNADTLRHLRSGAVLINTARGALIDEKALADWLFTDHLSQVFLDVREQEPPPWPDPLARFPQVRLTPHLAGLTEEALARTATQVLTDVDRVLKGELPYCPVRWSC